MHLATWAQRLIYISAVWGPSKARAIPRGKSPNFRKKLLSEPLQINQEPTHNYLQKALSIQLGTPSNSWAGYSPEGNPQDPPPPPADPPLCNNLHMIIMSKDNCKPDLLY